MAYTSESRFVRRGVTLEIQGTRLILNLRRAGGNGPPTPNLGISEHPMEFASSAETTNNHNVGPEEIELTDLGVSSSGIHGREPTPNNSGFQRNRGFVNM